MRCRIAVQRKGANASAVRRDELHVDRRTRWERARHRSECQQDAFDMEWRKVLRPDERRSLVRGGRIAPKAVDANLATILERREHLRQRVWETKSQMRPVPSGAWSPLLDNGQGKTYREGEMGVAL